MSFHFPQTEKVYQTAPFPRKRELSGILIAPRDLRNLACRKYVGKFLNENENSVRKSFFDCFAMLAMAGREARLLADFASTLSLHRPCRRIKEDASAGKLSGVTEGRDDAQGETKRTHDRGSRARANGRAEGQRAGVKSRARHPKLPCAVMHQP